MAGLQDTVANLARYRRFAADPLGASQTGQQTSSTGRLTSTETWGANPGGLRMLSYAPPGLRPNAAMVVVLHGCTQTAEGYAEGAGWLDLADRHGFLVLCPEQQAANNPNRCFNWFQPHDIRLGAGEAASIEQMIRRAMADHQIDPARVYVTGLSAGGAMTSVMLAACPEMFAGGAVVAGLPYGAAHNVQEALAAMFQGRVQSPAAWGRQVRDASSYTGSWPRVSIWHGEADATVKPINAEEIAKQWADLHHISGGSDRATGHNGWRRREWAGADGRAAVELNTIKGLGHGVPLAVQGPDGCGRPGPFLLEAGVSSSVEILRFWGLASQRSERAAPQVHQVDRPTAEANGPAKPHNPVPPFTQPQPRPIRPFAGVEQVIAKALASAGLIKPPKDG